jgi:erythritol transport system ATP-binding protein
VNEVDAAHPIVLSMEGVSKAYSGTLAVRNVDFAVRGGSVNVLVGENGAGKSTIVKMIAGVESPTTGVIKLDGAPVRFTGPADAIRHGVGMVFQELNLFGNLSVSENVFAARELFRFGRIDASEQRRRTAALLKRLNAPIDPDAKVEDLPVGLQQMVEIAKAVAREARILIMDEPTSALSAAEVGSLFRVIADLKAHGVAIVYISHRLEELTRIGDYITVLRDGRITGARPMREVELGWIVRQMIGANAKNYSAPSAHAFGAEALRVADMRVPRASGGNVVDGVSFSLRAGEILGFYGLMGAGRTELLESILGLRREATGTVVIDGRPAVERDVGDRMARGLALIPEDRQRDGLISIHSVASNITLASLGKLARGFHIPRQREARAVRATIDDLGVKASDPASPVSSLSGGNQQKVVIGKALLTGPKVLLMDEPSRGIDIGAKADVFSLMRRLAADGMAIVFATSDLEEVLALSDRIAVMADGRMTALMNRADADEEKVVAASAPARAVANLETQS